MNVTPGLILVSDLKLCLRTLRAAGLSVAVVEAQWQESANGPLETLSAREIDVLSMLASGFSYLQIAQELGISTKTVGTYMQRIREKTQLKTRKQLVALASQHGLV